MNTALWDCAGALCSQCIQELCELQAGPAAEHGQDREEPRRRCAAVRQRVAACPGALNALQLCLRWLWGADFAWKDHVEFSSHMPMVLSNGDLKQDVPLAA